MFLAEEKSNELEIIFSNSDAPDFGRVNWLFVMPKV